MIQTGDTVTVTTWDTDPIHGTQHTTQVLGVREVTFGRGPGQIVETVCVVEIDGVRYDFPVSDVVPV